MKSTSSAHESFPSQPEPNGDEAGYVVDVPEPTPDDLLASYRTYRAIGGDPFEPFEARLEAQIAAELRSGHPQSDGAQVRVMQLIKARPEPDEAAPGADPVA